MCKQSINECLIDELSIAAAEGDLDRVSNLLDQVTNLNIHSMYDAKGWYPLHWAAQEGHDLIVDLLLRSGSPVDQRTVTEQLTPLAQAICSGNERCVRLLLEYGANPNACSEFLGGATPLHTASAYNLDVIVKLLLSHGAHLGTRDLEGLTPLDVARLNGAMSAAAILSESLATSPRSP